MKIALRTFLALIFLLPVTPVNASDIEEILPSGLLGHASYNPGDANKPAILLLHGFLTVHNSNLIKNITNEIADNHYTVLAPTLTLGISKRKTTLDCSALHLHGMQSDLKEIDWWVNWLIKKGHKRIILMGHSSGSVQVIGYASTHKHNEIIKVIGLSTVPISDKDDDRFLESSKKANKMLMENNNNIETFTLSYCAENYSSPASEFTSYAEWDSARILKALNSIKVPKEIIKGSDDISVYASWITDLRKAGASVDIIDGADHFFGSGTEFDLYDSIMKAIAK